MNIKQTSFGRHWQHMLVKSTKVTFEDGTSFRVKAPMNGFIINNTTHAFMHNRITYMTVEQLKNCDACIVTNSCANSKNHFISTMYLVSYDTVVCEVRFLHENKHDKLLPYIEITFGEHWNHSNTTIQHVYKFLRMFGIYDLHLTEIAKMDKQNNNNKYSYEKYYGINYHNRVYCYDFSSADAMLNFKLNDASRIVWREM